MQPQYPQQPYNPYQGQPQSRFSLPEGRKQRFAIFGILGFIVFAIIIVVGAVLTSGPPKSAGLIEIAARQTEIARIAETGAKKGKSAETRNLATNLNISMKSDVGQITSRIQAEGGKVDKKTLKSRENLKTDEALIKAEQSNNFDAAFEKEIFKQLDAYQKALKRVYTTSPSEKTKSVLDELYRNAETFKSRASRQN
ncbi:hypothetical protein CR970_00550 [Candidatus Saccharibacteria bacterium]|nr:MAG: hypothetical protein CR970_00550 [Candidatus Saccharibacteria bacterium]